MKLKKFLLRHKIKWLLTRFKLREVLKAQEVVSRLRKEETLEVFLLKLYKYDCCKKEYYYIERFVITSQDLGDEIPIDKSYGGVIEVRKEDKYREPQKLLNKNSAVYYDVHSGKIVDEKGDENVFITTIHSPENLYAKWGIIAAGLGALLSIIKP